ncbi:MAG: hypothetical protein M3Q44_04735 [bacterium]|nr:hypothetical protein [bacterium]
MNYYLGVDAGGTKTHTLIVDENDQIVGEYTSGPGNPTSIGIEEAIDNIFESIIAAKLKAEQGTGRKQLPIISSCIGLAGLDTDKDKVILTSVLEKLFYKLKLKTPIIVNDVQIGLKSATDNKNAMAIICGTGSNLFGQNDQGKEVKVGGLEYLLSDEASGYYIGYKALRLAAKSYDGRVKKSVLEDLIVSELQVENMRDAKNIVQNYKKKDFAHLVYIVFEAFRQGDWGAIQIVNETVEEGFLMIKTAVDKLKYTKSFDIVYIGGLFENTNFATKMSEKIHSEFPLANIIFHKKAPAWGAIQMAKEVPAS